MAGRYESLDQAVAALSMVGLGLNYQDQRLRLEGIKTYGRALDGMKQIIGRGGLLYQEQTLATSLVMLKFELFETSGESSHGWKSHTNGPSQLIQLRGPMLHSSSLSHQLFLGLRPSVVSSSCLQ
ncbi:uncharacterized protein A1O9_06462 [Exophiala aquamarina CBS 119918]|uniref:Uncharacterized protein n=1 Tax=Exophiala aquamarina CBS 119918 TaxID=1182545 RepID=A0A072PF82_9EURO|nr:uncharacterized protein A1O9_06462 [Exophiala aquamarina CBS 119918]KEF58536.1 hypothetical protein A1O9_06462 [Exophiala aquamarina CBS 119918]